MKNVRLHQKKKNKKRKQHVFDENMSLTEAVWHGNTLRIVLKMLDANPDFQSEDENGCSLLDFAFQSEHHDKRILKLIASKFSLTDYQRLRLAVCTAKRWDEVKPFLPENINIQDNFHKTTLLMDAVNFGQINIARRLIREGANVNARDYLGWTALRYGEDNRKMAEMLIENGADINTEDNDGDTFLSCPLLRKTPIHFIRYALKHGADQKILCEEVETQFPFFSPHVQKLLLKSGIIARLKRYKEESILFGMTGYCGNELKIQLPCNIWVSIKSKHQEKPQIKIQNNTDQKYNAVDLISMSIDPKEPVILSTTSQLNLSDGEIDMISEWIKTNYVPLMQLWSEEITYRQFGNIVCK